MKKIQLLTFIYCCFIVSSVFSQSSPSPYATKGFVVDSATAKSVAFVRVTLKNVLSNTASLQATDTDRSFTIHNLHEENDSLSLTYIGHIAKNITIKPNKSGESDLDILLLIPEARELKEVTITANKALVKDTADRIALKILSTQSATSFQNTGIITTVLAKGNSDSNSGGTFNIIYSKAQYTWYFRVVWR